jgi:hypothetical protein
VHCVYRLRGAAAAATLSPTRTPRLPAPRYLISRALSLTELELGDLTHHRLQPGAQPVQILRVVAGVDLLSQPVKSL